MRLTLIHAFPRRLSLRVEETLDARAARAISELLYSTPGVVRVELRARARRVLVEAKDRAGVLAAWTALLGFELGTHSGPTALVAPRSSAPELARSAPSERTGDALREVPSREPGRPATEIAVRHPKREAPVRIGRATLVFAVGRMLSAPLQALVTLYSAYPYLRKGLLSLLSGKVGASVLDGTAIGTALVSGNAPTAGLISYLLTLGTYLEQRTVVRNEQELARLLDRTDSAAWVLRDGNEEKVLQRDLRVGDTLVLRAGYIAPADGVVIHGEALLNQSVVTGEAWPELMTTGAHVFEGATVVEGEVHVRVARTGAETRLSQMVRIIESSQHKKSDFESYAERLSDQTVPYVLSAAGLVYVLTGDPLRASAALLVDYSCALKLTVPMVFRAGVTQAGKRNILIKGAQWLERLSKVDAVAFDKTGTLTKGWPRVVEVLPLNGYSLEYLLRNVACVEEHFSHPIASAIVLAAQEAGLEHVIETHGPLKYLVSYGVVSSVGGDRFIVGGERVLKAHDIDTKPYRAQIGARERAGYSLVFVAVQDKLAGIITLEDELRAEAPEVITELRRLGMHNLVMLTGDKRVNAERIAHTLALDECHAELFPEQKVELLRELKQGGHAVAMLGDGLNDGPALSTADVGVSVASGADLSREVADVVLLGGSLDLFGDAVQIARATMARARRNFGYVLGINSALLALGMIGWIGPARSALLHNASTVLLSLNAARPIRLPHTARPALRADVRTPRVVSPLSS